MIKTLVNAWKVPDLRKKILFTGLMLAIFELGCVITVPGLKGDALTQLMGIGANATAAGSASVFNLLNIMGGGALENASIFAMSITPYVTASIILQLLTVAIPALERLAKEGQEGRKIIEKWTRYSTVILAFIQAAGIYIGLANSSLVEDPGLMSFAIIVISLTAGTAFLMWMGEQISDKGIGNGISVIIFTGIVTRVPSMIQQFIVYIQGGTISWLVGILIVVAILAVFALVVLMNDAERRIPVQYAKRVVGRKMYGGQSTHIPFKVAMAGVIPIIFASSLMAFPSTIAQLFGGAKEGSGLAKFLNFIGPTSWFYAVLYFVLIIFFTFFYTAMMYNPIEMSNNIKANGGFIPGIRPGRPTSEYISRVMNRVTVMGSIFIAFIAVLPLIAAGSNVSLGFSGTSLLILVGVALETYRQLESQLMMRHYKGFLE